MSKAHFVHWRYTAVRLEGEKVDRRALNQALAAMGRARGLPEARWPSLTRFAWPHAIMRVQHMDAWPARDWLAAGIDVKHKGETRRLEVETLSSSGTIKTLTQRLGILQQR